MKKNPMTKKGGKGINKKKSNCVSLGKFMMWHDMTWHDMTWHEKNRRKYKKKGKWKKIQWQKKGGKGINKKKSNCKI